MPNYTYVCQCNETIVENMKISDRDLGPSIACSKCNKTEWVRVHCESKHLNTFWPGAHRNEYTKKGRRNGM